MSSKETSPSETSDSNEAEAGNEQKNNKKSLKDFSARIKNDTQYVFPISETRTGKRQVTISKFKGKVRVDIREYYLDNDDWKPGKKGISLDMEQFEELENLLPLIKEACDELGGSK